MVRRQQPDPLLLQTVSTRLARLLEETAPARGGPEDAPPSVTTGAPARAASPLEDLDELPEPPRFRRVHVGVVAALLVAGLLWCGWSLFRARPVALAAPPTIAVSTTDPASAPTVAGPSSPSVPAPSLEPTAGTGPGAGASPAGRVVVHVLGAVRSPGLVTLPPPARVQDAVDAAGGFTRRADPGELNLAQLLQDGQQVLIGTTGHPDGEVRSSSGSGGNPGAAPGSSSSGTALDLNQADATQLEELPGVGPVTAGAIVAWRTEHGRFGRIEELQEVDGIGPKTYAQIAPHVRV